MKRYLTPRMCSIAFLLSAVLFVVQIFMPLISGGDGIFALTEPLQAGYKAVECPDAAGIVVYVLYALGIALMGVHMLCGFEKSRGHLLFKAGLLLQLAAALVAIYRMYSTYGHFQDFFSRIGMPLYLNAMIYFLLAVDALTGYRIYPVNAFILLIAALVSIAESTCMVISGLFDRHAGDEWYWALIYLPSCVHNALFCAGLAGSIALIHKNRTE